MKTNLPFLFPIMSGLVLLIGCGQVGTWSESRQVMLYPVTGVVMLDGEPVAGAQVLFQPADESQQNLIGTAETDASGRFTLETVQAGPGAVAGSHNVRVCKTVVTNINTNFDPEAYVPPVTEKNLLPAKYNSFDKSGLTFEVSDVESTHLTIELDSQAK
ncbi:DUF6795 domain-containing protein [Blastopirellula marina]|nr:DUF6795 domain-containing protein [Blastopirellula marina]